MIAAGSRLRQIGWALALVICMVAFLALTLKVNTVKSEVRLAERDIIALERDKMLLETEFETRASQQQLAQWNAVEFGYQAPTADQYLENERQLASLGQPRGLDAPLPIRVAYASDTERDARFPALVSPLSGKPVRREPEVSSVAEEAVALADRLANGGDFLAEVDQ